MRVNPGLSDWHQQLYSSPCHCLEYTKGEWHPVSCQHEHKYLPGPLPTFTLVSIWQLYPLLHPSANIGATASSILVSKRYFCLRILDCCWSKGGRKGSIETRKTFVAHDPLVGIGSILPPPPPQLTQPEYPPTLPLYLNLSSLPILANRGRGLGVEPNPTFLSIFFLRYTQAKLWACH